MRIQLPEARVQDLKKLMAESGLDTYKDVFNNALSAFEWILHEAKSGRSIASVDDKNQSYRVLVMPALQRVAKTARKEQPAYSAS